MTIELKVLTGARTGQRERYEKSVIAIGRHPLSDLRFDPEGDRDVSSRHAELRVVDGRCSVRDLNSTNGTFVNGARIDGERVLQAGDVLALGEMGPKVEFRVPSGDTAAPAAGTAGTPGAAKAGAFAEPASTREASPRSPHADGRSTGERIAIAVSQHTQALRRMLVGAIALLVVGVGGTWWLGQRESRERGAQLDALLLRNDSLSQAFEQDMERMSGKLTGLDTACTTTTDCVAVVAQAKHESDALRARLVQVRSGDASSANVEMWSAKLERAETRRQRLMTAANMDARAVNAANGAAVLLIAVEMPDGHAFSGTGFSVTSNGLVVTNRHLLSNDAGQAARRVLVIFSDTREWLPARVVKVSTTDDLAFLQIEVAGRYPKVSGLAASASRIEVGSPVAIIGYPFGTQTPMEGSGTRITARSTLGVGTVSKLLAEVLQIDAYAGEGSSGSPLFDARGDVVGVIYGGARESAGRIVYAVPGEKLLAQLPAAGRP